MHINLQNHDQEPSHNNNKKSYLNPNHPTQNPLIIHTPSPDSAPENDSLCIVIYSVLETIVTAPFVIRQDSTTSHRGFGRVGVVAPVRIYYWIDQLRGCGVFRRWDYDTQLWSAGFYRGICL